MIFDLKCRMMREKVCMGPGNSEQSRALGQQRRGRGGGEGGEVANSCFRHTGSIVYQTESLDHNFSGAS